MIISNDSLVSLKGLDSLGYIGDEFGIFSNVSLMDLSGLGNLTHIESGISIWLNISLISLTGLGSLSYALKIHVWSNPSLTNLNGLNSIASMGGPNLLGSININENNSLNSLSGLDNIDPNTINKLIINNNSSLSTCHVKSICDYLAAPGGTVSIYGNAPGCSTREEVEAACAGGMQTDIRIFLQGAYTAGGMMSTNLDSLLPCLQPYDTTPRNYTGTETLSTVPTAMADWVLVELRDSADYNLVSDTRAGALFSDGTVKDTNLVTGLCFYNIDTGYYYVAIHHRNHISVMTGQPVYFPLQSQIDFTDTNSVKPVGGAAQAQIELEPGKWGMICGDINNDGILKYSGPGNDRMAIIQRITGVTGSTNITKTISGYYNEDLDLNTHVKYSGPSNDGAIIIQNIITLTGSTSITATYSCPVLFLYP